MGRDAGRLKNDVAIEEANLRCQATLHHARNTQRSYIAEVVDRMYSAACQEFLDPWAESSTGRVGLAFIWQPNEHSLA